MRGATQNDIKLRVDYISSVIQVLSDFTESELEALYNVLYDVKKNEYTIKNKQAIYSKYCEYQQKKSRK